VRSFFGYWCHELEFGYIVDTGRVCRVFEDVSVGGEVVHRPLRQKSGIFVCWVARACGEKAEGDQPLELSN